MTLVDQTVLRGPDGIRWVVQTQRLGSGYRVTARKTGCDLTPAGTAEAETPNAARAAHEQLCAAIKARGVLGDSGSA